MNSCDIIIIGSGPGGYELAANAVKRNLSTVIIERDQLGGTCLNRGCIPTKALCRSAEVADLVRNASSFGVEVNEFSLSYAKAVNRKDAIVEQLRQGVSMLLNGATVIKGEDAVISGGVKTGRRGIEVNERYETSIPGIYAIGDVNGECMLAHAATAQGERIIGSEVDVTVVPAAVFTLPECSMVGLTEEQCREQGIDYIASKAMFRANGKALAMGEVDGLVKLIVEKESRKILGCHICGPHAADIVQEIALAISSQLTVDAVVDTIHAHPTLGDVVRAAASAL